MHHGGFYRKLGFDSIVINGTMDGAFPWSRPGSQRRVPAPAARSVPKSQADYGVGFDPDADRGIIIDDLGRVLPPEKVAIIIARPDTSLAIWSSPASTAP